MSEKEGTARVKLMLTPTANKAGDLFPLWVANHLTFTGGESGSITTIFFSVVTLGKDEITTKSSCSVL